MVLTVVKRKGRGMLKTIRKPPW